MKILIVFLLFLFFPLKAYAHTIEYSKTIGAVLHVDPNDSPVALKDSNIYIDFKDKTGRFKLTDCDCSVNIIHDKVIVYATPLHAPDDGSNVAHIPYIFSYPGIYRIVINGEPVPGKNFEAFTLSYPVRVTPNKDSASKESVSKDYVWMLGIPIAAGCVLIGRKLLIKKKK